MKGCSSKAARLFLKVILGILTAILLTACSYVLFNAPFTSSLKKLSSEELQTYTEYLDTNLSDPQQFVAEKFDHYDVGAAR